MKKIKKYDLLFKKAGGKIRGRRIYSYRKGRTESDGSVV